MSTNRNNGLSSPAGSQLQPIGFKADGWIVLVVALAGSIFHTFYFNHGIHNLMDLGVLATDSVRVLDGEIYGLDFHAPYGPARYYLLAGIFLIFGKSLFVLNSTFVGIMALSNILLYLGARFFMSRPFAVLAAGLGVIAHGSIHKSFFILSVLSVLIALLGFLTRRTMKTAFFMGLIIGGVALFRWDVGVAACCAAVVLVLLSRLARLDRDVRLTAPRLGGLMTGVLVVLIPVTLALCMFSDPLQILHHMKTRALGVDHVLTDFESWAALFSSPEPRARLFSAIALFLIVPLAICSTLAAFRLFRGKDPQALYLTALVLIGLPALNQVHIQIRFNRLLHAAPVLYIALSLVLFEIARKAAGSPRSRWRRFARPVPFLLGILFLGLLATYLHRYTGLASQDSVAALRYEERFVSHPRFQCFMRKGLARDVEEALAIMQRRLEPEDRLFADASSTLFYFALDRSNPTPYNDWLYYYFNPDGEKRMIEGLERSQARFCILWPGRPVARAPFEQACPELQRYLDECFTPAWKGRRFVLLERRGRW